MTSNTGFGNSPLGVGAYGFGTPATAPTPGGKVNRDATGKQLGSLAISVEQSTRGQYIFDEFGRRTGVPDAHHLAILALTEVKGKCILKTLGNEFFQERKVYENFKESQTQLINDALSDLVTRKVLTIDAITVEPGDGHPSITHVLLTDLTTNTPIDIPISNG
jgi:hypothetical protein